MMDARQKPWLKFAICMLAWIVFWPLTLAADEFSPALLDITERPGGWVDVIWKVPVRGSKTLAIKPVLPAALVQIGAGASRKVAGAQVDMASYKNNSPSLTGLTLQIDGLAATPIDVLIRIALDDGTEHSAILRGGIESYTIPERPTWYELSVSYWKMGTIHILEGFDHLFFLLALLLIVTGLWPLLKTVTAFTLAHSLTLALATLGIVHIPSVPTEAVISLSILFLAVEIVRKSAGQLTLSEKRPWLVAFIFGLVHGLGFAGALSEIGLPPYEVPLALLMFNLGVETGQVMFVVTVALLLAGLNKSNEKAGLVVVRTAPYAIGGLAAFWTIERIAAFV